ncbi:type I-E CRISPR-associated protein Cas7/Cse4/CasC [Geminicoccaceae bacterium 1502E]|nr:type I-E CRISPR-associated protein Cas7/Cse4/CasC [Geminicoccaceae bacterium 1502E]
MSAPRFVQIHTLHSYPATLLNRDDAGLAKRIPFGGVERLRISSQCLKRHWRKAEDQMAIANAAPEIGRSVRSRRSWQVLLHDPLVAEGLPSDAVTAVLAAMQEALYGESRKAKAAKGAANGVVDLERDELVVLGRPEIEHLARETRRIVGIAGSDAKKIAAELKELRANFHAIKAGAGLDAAMFGRFVSGDREARVDAAVHVAHALTVHPAVSEPDYFSAVDDLPAEDQGSGAGHINTADLTTGLYYGYVVVDVPLLVANLEGCRQADWLAADRAVAARTVQHLLHLIAKVTPGAKLGSTAPYSYASLVLAEAGDEQPRTLANAFLTPLRQPPLEEGAARALAARLAAVDAMYGNEGRRWLATSLPDPGVAGATACTLPAMAEAVAAAIRGEV